VQEVATAPALATGIPHTESVVLGVMGFRETLLPLLSLRGLLGFAQDQVRGTGKIVVTRIGDALVGLLADRMTGSVSATDDEMEDIPEILAARVGGESRIRAIYRGDSGQRLIPVLSTEELFGEEVMRKLETARNAPQAAPQPDMTAKTVQFVVFRLGEDEFGLPIDAVEEVMRMPDQVARLPKTPKFLEGVVNLRGEVLPVVDQRRRFNMPAGEGMAGRRLVVVRTHRHRAGLIVDSVSEVLRTREDEVAAAPTLTGESSALVRGVVNLERSGRIILLLDPSELLTRAEHGLLDKFSRDKPAEPPGT
jgi:purine-binding chemotaxis protein CheW